jgi:hypothetical protein
VYWYVRVEGYTVSPSPLLFSLPSGLVGMSEPKPLYEERIEGGFTARFWVDDNNWIMVEVIDENGDSITGIYKLRTDAKQLLKDPKVRMDFAKATIVALSFFKRYHRYTGWSYMFARRFHKGSYDVKIW